MNHCQRDEVPEGLVWLARGLEVVPEDETELQQSFRRLLAGWSQQIHPLKQVLPVAYSSALSPNGKLLAEWLRTPADAVQLRAADTCKPLGKPIAQRSRPDHMIFSPDSKLFASACYDNSANRFSVQVWDVATGEPVGASMHLDRRTLKHLPQLAFSPDGNAPAHVSRPRPRRVWHSPVGSPHGQAGWRDATDKIHP